MTPTLMGFDDCYSLGRKEILDGMLGANLVCFQVCNLMVDGAPLCFSDALVILDVFLFSTLHLDVYPSMWL